MLQHMNQNIILTGFMGSGKTTVGERLARRLGYQFQDTDKLIEARTKDTISRIFHQRGEEYFRELEINLLQELLPKLHHTVLSTGGGIILKEVNRKVLQQMGHVIYLKTSASTISKRLEKDHTRPLLQGEDPAERIIKLLEFREPMYEDAAHSIIVTDDRTHEEVVEMILDAYQQARR